MPLPYNNLVPAVTPAPDNTIPGTTGSPPVTVSNVNVIPFILALYKLATPPINVVTAPVNVAVPFSAIADVNVAGVSREGFASCMPGVIFSYNVAVICILLTDTGLLIFHVLPEPLTI